MADFKTGEGKLKVREDAGEAVGPVGVSIHVTMSILSVTVIVTMCHAGL